MISLSFDDGREDTYSIAYPIMKKYGLLGTIHITTGFIDGTWEREDWPSAANGPMSIDEIKEMYKAGFEMTSHGNEHKTSEEDLKLSIKKLIGWGVISEEALGFSLPHSLEPENAESIYRNCHFRYVRGGRAKACYTLWGRSLYIMQAITRSKRCFYLFNKPNVMKKQDVQAYRLSSTVIKAHNTARQIIYFLDQVDSPDNFNILMFHSILSREDAGYGKDAWYFDEGEFEKLCKWLSENRKGQVVTIKEGVNRCLQRNGQK